MIKIKFCITLCFTLMLLALALSTNCTTESGTNQHIKDSTGVAVKNIPVVKQAAANDTVVNLKYNGITFSTSIRFPKNTAIVGNIIALHGWNLPATDWCNKTSLCEKALKQGYVLILPDFGKSIYAEKVYTDTRKDWVMYPTRTWIKDSFLVFIQAQFGLLQPGQKNFILGLSTGARGVALLCLDCRNVFTKAAALSGDYDQTKLKNDNIYKGFYGSFGGHELTWLGSENIVSRVKEFNTPIYLSHGKQDKVVPCNQTIEFYDSLKKYRPALNIRLRINEKAAHNYAFWNSELDSVLAFFKN